MTTPDPSREAFLSWFTESGMTKYQETAWAAWQAAMAHKGAPTASDTTAPLELAIKSAPSDQAGAKSSLGIANDARNTAIANACDSVRPPPADAIAVNLMRHVGLDKHVARECERIVRQLLQPAAPKHEGST